MLKSFFFFFFNWFFSPKWKCIFSNGFAGYEKTFHNLRVKKETLWSTCVCHCQLYVLFANDWLNCLPSTASCRDTHMWCESWAERGECKINPNWMLPNCPKSCHQCKDIDGKFQVIYILNNLKKNICIFVFRNSNTNEIIIIITPSAT